MGNTASFQEMLQRWQDVGNTVTDLTGPRFEPETSCSKNKRVAAPTTGQSSLILFDVDFLIEI